MSSSPSKASEEKKLQTYGQSWSELLSAVRQGTSWSGQERNRCLLSLSGTQFADASSLSGLNFDDDSRSIAVTDWNRDGKPDLWFRNRTAPRLRLMLNQTPKSSFLAIRLQGVNCNRDAVGAVVEVNGGAQPLIRELRAGEMFLSQASKWLHFGLGKQAKVQAVTVTWPGGTKEQFSGLSANGRFLLKEGSGAAQSVREPASVAKLPKPPQPKKSQYPRSSRLPVAMPFSRLHYRDATAQLHEHKPSGRPQLIMIWESSCDICAHDLKKLAESKKQLEDAGLEVLALSADQMETWNQAYSRIDKSGYQGTWGLCEADSLRNLWKWQGAWFERQEPPSVPISILLDGRGQGIAFYRGQLSIDAVLQDAKEVVNVDPLTRWHLAPPLQGSWFTNPISREFVYRSILTEMQN